MITTWKSVDSRQLYPWVLFWAAFNRSFLLRISQHESHVCRLPFAVNVTLNLSNLSFICWRNPMVWPFKRNLFIGTFTFMWYHLSYIESGYNLWVFRWNPIVLPFEWNRFATTFAYNYLYPKSLQKEVSNFIDIFTLVTIGVEQSRQKISISHA